MMTCLMLCAPQFSVAQQGELRGAIPEPYRGPLPSLAALNIRNARLERYLEGLSEPWAFEFISDDEILVTQIRGKMSRFNLTSERLQNLEGLPGMATNRRQTGLLDIEVHPDFDRNSRIYFSYTVSDDEVGRFYLLAVATAVLEGSHLRDVREFLRSGPFGWSPANFGGALEFDDQGYLFVTIGDRSEPVFAQDGLRLEGKLLRLADDGSVPPDNPFVGDPAFDDRVYALGLRNAQGLHFDTSRGVLFEAEHGPMGGDEINIMRPGLNYGWPVISYGRNYTLETIGEGTHREGLEQPAWYYLPSIAVSPLTVYRGPMFPEWEGDLLVGALKGKRLSKIDLDGLVVRSESAMLQEIGDRVRDIRVGPDGSIFILTQSKGLFRLYRDPGEEPQIAAFQPSEAYGFVCAGCHDTGAAGAPVLSRPDEWRTVLGQSIDVTYRNTFEGKGGMPDRGMCHICSDDHLRRMVDWMLDKVRSTGTANPSVPQPPIE
jgi:glucose/arabinose dehydrogenase/cytochrome c5